MQAHQFFKMADREAACVRQKMDSDKYGQRWALFNPTTSRVVKLEGNKDAARLRKRLNLMYHIYASCHDTLKEGKPSLGASLCGMNRGGLVLGAAEAS